MQHHLGQFTVGLGLLVFSIDTAIWGIWPISLLALFFGTILVGVSFRKD